MNRRIIVEFYLVDENKRQDIDVPLDITANELVIALTEAYHLEIDLDNVQECYLKAENPICFLKGNKTLQEFGLREGSIVIFDR